MDYLSLLKAQFNDRVDFRSRDERALQLVAPLYHEDGDMIDIFLEESLADPSRIRVSDYGMTLMRLSYSYDLNTPNKERLFQRILAENGVQFENGNIFLETSPTHLYPAILQFAQVVGKVSNMRMYRRETVQSLFYEMLAEFVEESLGEFHPSERILPIPERDDLEVDFEFDIRPHPIYLFGVKDATKARLATISMLEFQKQQLAFKGYVVHEDFDGLPKKDRARITSAADKQFVSLEDFKENAERVLRLEVA
ncbi:MAG: DUF1828 domain-containing protein [Actinobacteria bacterium]|nr:DUF1828 domain-containing protein [Actinomycetota bacterium]